MYTSIGSKVVLLASIFVLFAPISAIARSLASQEPPPATSSEQAPAQTSLSMQPLDFTDEVVRSVLGKLQRGIQDHRLDEVLTIFDPEITLDYPAVKDQLRAFLARYDGIEFRYKILQETSDKENGYVICDIDMDAVPTDDSQMPIRKGVQMRFQLKRGAGGEWKVVAFRPADFFSR